MIQKAISSVLVLFMAFALFAATRSAAHDRHDRPDRHDRHDRDYHRHSPKNFIMVIPDGMGASHAAILRALFHAKRDGSDVFEPSTLDKLLTGSVSTYPHHSQGHLTPDSASAATSLATGVKTRKKYIATDAEKHPYITIMEAAKSQKNMKTGIVMTHDIGDATGACYYAHTTNRNDKRWIAKQLLNSDYGFGQVVDFIIGGGRKYFVNSSNWGDNRDLLAEFQASGYSYIPNREALLALDLSDPALRVLGLFAWNRMNLARDRQNSSFEPSLVEMTNSLLSYLSAPGRSPNGFFAMVESSRIDSCGHFNDPVCLAHELKEFEETVDVILEFAQRIPNTQVVIAADHDTGGTLAGGLDGHTLIQKHWVDKVDRTVWLKRANLTCMAMARYLIEHPNEDLQTALTAHNMMDPEGRVWDLMNGDYDYWISGKYFPDAKADGTAALKMNDYINAMRRLEFKECDNASLSVPEWLAFCESKGNKPAKNLFSTTELTPGRRQAMIATASKDVLLRAYSSGQFGRRMRSIGTTIGHALSQYAGVIMSTTEHTGYDVNLYAYGPYTPLFTAHLDNTDIAKRAADALGLEIGIPLA